MFAFTLISCDPAQFAKKGFRFDLQIGEKPDCRIFSFVAKTEKECMVRLRSTSFIVHANFIALKVSLYLPFDFPD